VVRLNDFARLRKRMGISQRTMAQLIDSTQAMVARMEKGEVGLIKSAEKLIAEYGLGKNDTKTPLKLQLVNQEPLQTNELQCTKLEHSLYLKKDETSRDWERWWWNKTNKLCLQCALPCKQSSRVKIILCPQYQKKD